MNTNITLKCSVCEQDTDCRIGYSNRKIQPLSFACPHCGSIMQVTLDISNSPDSGFKFKNCHQLENRPSGPFDGTNPFVDLHLDFPVRFGKYIMGNTPYIMAMQELHDSTDSNSNSSLEKISFHSNRLNQLNYFYNKSENIKTIIRLYEGSNKQLFKKKVGEFLGVDQGPSLKPQDVNVSLYNFVSFLFLPFIHFGEVKQFVYDFTDLMMRLSGKNFSDFVGNLVSSGFLSTLQKDCLRIYPEIYDAEMAMRPALYLDLIPEYEKAKTAARISTKDFQLYKETYKDIVEVFSRQLVLVSGINNLIHRGHSDLFKSIDGGTLSSLEKFSGKTLTDKFKYLDDCWYILDKDVVDAGVRNSIAHNNIKYNEVTQEITYYPGGGGLQQTTGKTIYFLDFMRMMLVLFREMHNLHHLIKCLFYYEFIIRNK